MKARKILAAVSAMALSITMCGCGESEEERAAEQAEMEQEKAEALLDLGVGDLPSGLSGSCSGDNENLASVRLDTMSQYLGVEIDNPYIDPTKDVLYSIILTSPESGQQTQVGIKMMSTGESLRFVNDMEGTNQKNYGPLGENDLTDTLLSTSIPDPAIQAGRTMEWHAILTVDGYDVATCPATGEAELKQDSMCDEIPESARETMRVVNETLDAYTSGELSEDEAGARVFHALFDRMMDK